MEVCMLAYALLIFDLLTLGSGSLEVEKKPEHAPVSGSPEYNSLVHQVRLKIANLYNLRDKIKMQQSRPQKILTVGSDGHKFLANNSFANNIEQLENLTLLNQYNSSDLNVSPQHPLEFEKLTSRATAPISLPRNGFFSKLLPKTDILKRLAKMRDTLEPNLRNFLTTKYNDFLTNLVPYSTSIGVAPFMLNSMKIPENFDPRWSYIQNILETSSLEQFLNTLPEMSSFSAYAAPINDDPREDSIQSRNDDDFISDQEPHATSKGKKKYGTLRLPARVKAYRKGEALPERGAFEYATFGDQYGLYSPNSYDSYGKGYDDYSALKGSGSYDDYAPSKGGKAGGKFNSANYADLIVAPGHNSYSTHGGGGGHSGGYGSSLGGYLDPFSILGGLAFLVYLGLLFQQSLNMTAGRSLPDSIFSNRFESPIKLTVLSLGKNEDRPSLEFSFRNRKGRSEGDVEETLQEAGTFLDLIWKDIQSLKSIRDVECRHQKLCQVVKNMESRNLLPIFIEALEKEEDDRQFLNEILNQIHGSRIYFDCQLKLSCEG